MKRYEKATAVAMMVLGLVMALYLAMRSDAGSITETALWPLLFLAASLQLTAFWIVKRGWEKETGQKAVLFFDFGAKKDPTE